ncbi:hypothetical protein [Amycolatopsis sp. FDAARGOS 1241]|uniref:hypothetical protein n=1 Tax=Amycolatopsis sp. FDAARGOS 1241 TaxID=2778070 RepID=UPI00351C4756
MRLPVASALAPLRDLPGASARCWALAADEGAQLAEVGWNGPLEPDKERWLRRLADAMPCMRTPFRFPVTWLTEQFPLLRRFLDGAVKPLTPLDAVSAVLSGTTEVDSAEIEVISSGRPAALRGRLTRAPDVVEPPAG